MDFAYLFEVFYLNFIWFTRVLKVSFVYIYKGKNLSF